MPPRSSRRTAANRIAGPRPAAGGRPTTPPDDLQVDLPASASDDAVHGGHDADRTGDLEPYAGGAAARPLGSSKRTRVSSSRRTTGGSGAQRDSAKKPVVKRHLTPEEEAARRQATVFAVKIVAGLAVLFALAFAGWWFLVRQDRELILAQNELREARAKIGVIESAISRQQSEAAWAAYNEAEKTLSESPRLGYAAEHPQPNDQLVSPQLAGHAHALISELRTWKGPIEKLERDEKARLQANRLMDRFGKLLDPATDLDVLEKDANAFQDNPVEPGANRNETYVKDYPELVNGVKVQMQKIATEKAARLDARTKAPVDRCFREVEELVKRESFQEALGKVDEYARNFTEADFATVRSYIEESAQKAWDSVDAFVKTHYADYAAPGTTEAGRGSALTRARERLDQVIATWGVEKYLAQAKELLAKYPQP